MDRLLPDGGAEARSLIQNLLTAEYQPYKVGFVVTHRAFMGEFEQMVMAAVLRLGDGAYGAAIIEEIEARTGRAVRSGALYITLDRLEQKGLIETWLRDPTPERGGRPKRYVRVTRSGLEALRESREALLSLWRGIERRIETSKS